VHSFTPKDKEVQEAENYLKDQANTKFPKRIEHVTTQWITDTLHNINSLDKVVWEIGILTPDRDTKLLILQK
jgi:hypothetical protein